MTKEKVVELLNWYIYDFENEGMEWPDTELIANEYFSQVVKICKECGKNKCECKLKNKKHATNK